jgi:hypothetical protein
MGTDGGWFTTKHTKDTKVGREGIGKTEKLKTEIGRGFLTANRRE